MMWVDADGFGWLFELIIVRCAGGFRIAQEGSVFMGQL